MSTNEHDPPGPPIHPVILSGGAGVRLWPLSRELFPKTLLALHTHRSMLQETALRVLGPRFAAPLIVTNAEHRFLVAEQMRTVGIHPAKIVLEPMARNTAPAAAVAARYLNRNDGDSLMLVMPSDHVIEDAAAFRRAVESAIPAAVAGALVTFGINPSWPEIGYGYIEAGAAWPDAEGCFAVKRFVEKPDRATAETWLARGGFHWNSGIFLFSAESFIAELAHAMRLVTDKAFRGARDDGECLVLDANTFAKCKSVSIDHAVMERTKNAVVVPVEMGWSDVGSFAALWRLGKKDRDGNVIAGDVVTTNVRNSYIRSDGPLVAAVGIEDAVVVATADAVLATTIENAQDVKALVETLKKANRPEHAAHALVRRPWGSYRIIDAGEGFQVKHITVDPQGALSLQLHKHRAEHWVIVEGTGRVTVGAETNVLSANQSAYIPPETQHRLENVGDGPLRIIEVQSGSYLGEDDIVRFEDVYGR
ncbi:MAG: mannose-1-phosphate guanylyltransferase/mannose-6-phosphate isomerase, partial [Rhodospirillales bacterium]|nr:mannose-1-phosphate guanylyltransferase/mannose-6-phosphate isomerase [Rhodospirillales bacterium]